MKSNENIETESLVLGFGLVLMIFNEVAYLTHKSIFNKALNLF